MLYSDLMRYQEAIVLLQQYLKILDNMLLTNSSNNNLTTNNGNNTTVNSNQDVRYLQIQYQISILYIKFGKIHKAEELILACLNSRLDVLGADHSDTIRTNALLGYVYTTSGRYTDAEKILKQCVEDGWYTYKCYTITLFN